MTRLKAKIDRERMATQIERRYYAMRVAFISHFRNPTMLFSPQKECQFNSRLIKFRAGLGVKM